MRIRNIKESETETCELSFGIGTVPALVVVGIVGQSGGRHWPRTIAAAAPAMRKAGLTAVVDVDPQSL